MVSCDSIIPHRPHPLAQLVYKMDIPEMHDNLKLSSKWKNLRSTCNSYFSKAAEVYNDIISFWGSKKVARKRRLYHSAANQAQRMLQWLVALSLCERKTYAYSETMPSLVLQYPTVLTGSEKSKRSEILLSKP